MKESLHATEGFLRCTIFSFPYCESGIYSPHHRPRKRCHSRGKLCEMIFDYPMTGLACETALLLHLLLPCCSTYLRRFVASALGWPPISYRKCDKTSSGKSRNATEEEGFYLIMQARPLRLKFLQYIPFDPHLLRTYCS